MSPSPSSVEEAVELFLALRRSGDATDPVAFAAGYPEFQTELVPALEALVTLERALPDPREAPLPERVGAFRVVREIGRGGMGIVLEAVEEPLERRVALKLLAPGLVPNLSALARFRREAALAARLDHPCIATVYGAGFDAERSWIAMRFVEGRTLAHAIRDAREKGLRCAELGQSGLSGRQAALDVAFTLAKIARALQFAHERNVLHRDVKPSNIIVAPDGTPVLLDFGLAIAEESDEGALTRTGETAGTPAYFAPEIVSGARARPDVQGDVYALGVTLFECLALRRPFDGPTPVALYRAILSGEAPNLRTLNRDVPRDLSVVVATAMERDRGRRYHSAAALAEDLEACIAGRPIAARPIPFHGRVLRWARREPRLAAATAAAILLAIGGPTWVSLVQAAASRALAEKNTVLAAEKSRAETNELLATTRAEDVLSLSAIQELKELVERADLLWPAFPDKLADYDRWLADAQVLVGGRAPDASRGIAAHPGLKDHEAKLAEIRQLALPLTPAQVDADRRSSPNLAEWERERAKLTWMRRMLGEDAWPKEADIEAELAKTTLPNDAGGLNRMAWPLVDPDLAKAVYGSEIKGLLFARRAVAATDESERSGARDTLAWGLFRCGRLEEALAEEQRAVDEAKDSQKQELAASLKQMREEVARWKPGEMRSKRSDEASQIAVHIAELEQDVGVRRTFEFDNAQDRWWHAQLSQLVADLKAFSDEKTGLDSGGTSEQHGWGIARRRKEAATIEERSVSGAEAARRWAEARASIAKSAKYGGLELTPQIGLLPIGEDPDSHLWEFAHLQTGDPALRDSDGKLIPKEEMGLVFVLIPAGTFWMGGQKADPTGHNYDPQSRDDESPVQAVKLDAYFLSKYEMTQGQWERFTGRNPSSYKQGNSSRNYNRAGRSWSTLHPVEQVSWLDCELTLQRLGLVLPTEAQWERGARAGTETAWWTGDKSLSLSDAGNVADSYGKSHGAGFWSAWERELDDGNTIHAEIGSYRANAFGLHDTIGNVWEWCRDGFTGYAWPVRAGDAERPLLDASKRAHRGGSFTDVASYARSACRINDTPEFRVSCLGVRPARVAHL